MLPLWSSFWLVTLGFVLFRTFYLYRLLHVGVALAVLVLCIATVPSRRFIERALLSAFPALLLIAYVLLSIMWAQDAAFALYNIAVSFGLALATLTVSMVWKYRYSLLEISGFFEVLALGYIALCGLNQFQFGDMMALEKGSFRSELGVVAVVCIPVLIARFLARRSLRSVVIAVALGALTIHGQSRTALIGLALAALALSAMHFRVRLLPLYVSGVLAVLALISANPPSVLDRFAEDQLSLESGEAVLHELSLPPAERVDFDRRLMLYVAERELFHNPLIGIGYMQLSETIDREFGRVISAHGLVPGLIAEIGLIGGLLVALVILACLHSLWRGARSTGPPGEKLMYAHLVVAFVLLVLFGFFHQLIESPFFYLLAGIALMRPGRRTEFSPLAAAA